MTFPRKLSPKPAAVRIAALKNMRYFASWVDARNASCDYSPLWQRIGLREGFLMVWNVGGAHQKHFLIVAP